VLSVAESVDTRWLAGWQVPGDLPRSALPRHRQHGTSHHRAHLVVRRRRHVTLGQFVTPSVDRCVRSCHPGPVYHTERPPLCMFMSPWASLSHRASTAVYDHVALGQFITVSIYRCLHTFMSPWAVFYQQREHLTVPTANTSTGNTSDVTSGSTPPAFCSSNASGQNELKAPLTSFPVAARSLVCHIPPKSTTTFPCHVAPTGNTSDVIIATSASSGRSTDSADRKQF